MRVVIQRVRHASVTIDGVTVARISLGLLVLLGIGPSDDERDVDYLVRKTLHLRIFDDDAGVMNRSVLDIDGEVLVVSQFTLMASTKKGNRPSYIGAASHSIAIPLYESFCRLTEEIMGKPVATGTFGAEMEVALLNDGPVTICIDSKA